MASSGVRRLAMNRAQARKSRLSPQKAKKILRDGSVRGKKITKKQRGFFGARASK